MANVLSVLRRIERLEEKAPKELYVIIDYRKIMISVQNDFIKNNDIQHSDELKQHRDTILKLYERALKNAFKKANNKHGKTTILINDL